MICCAGSPTPNTPTATATPTMTPHGSIPTATATPTPPATPTARRGESGACVGDCNGNGTVTVDDLIRMVNIALDLQPLCPGEGGLGCLSGDANCDCRDHRRRHHPRRATTAWAMSAKTSAIAVRSSTKPSARGSRRRHRRSLANGWQANQTNLSKHEEKHRMKRLAGVVGTVAAVLLLFRRRARRGDRAAATSPPRRVAPPPSKSRSRSKARKSSPAPRTTSNSTTLSSPSRRATARSIPRSVPTPRPTRRSTPACRRATRRASATSSWRSPTPIRFRPACSTPASSTSRLTPRSASTPCATSTSAPAIRRAWSCRPPPATATITVREAPTPTPTPLCRNNEDCPDGAGLRGRLLASPRRRPRRRSASATTTRTAPTARSA